LLNNKVLGAKVESVVALTLTNCGLNFTRMRAQLIN
jgi:hypothetical protein